MKSKPVVYFGTLALAVAGALGTWTYDSQADGNAKVTAPKYKVDPFWPKPLPDKWVTGEVAGTCLDSKDHLFIVNRGFQTGGLQPPENQTAKASPPVIEFDKAGNVVNAWGDPTYNTAMQGTLGPGTNAVLPNSIHGCFVDYQDNVWIGGNGDGVVQKYSHNGTFLMQIGVKGVCDGPGGKCGSPGLNSSHVLLNQPADIAVDPSNGDVYIADGYGNHRVVVFNKNGVWLRQWGSAGTAPGQFAAGDGGHPHCVVIGNDNLVYACDRGQDRIQVFDKLGNLKKVIPVKPGTGTPGLGTAGSAWDVDFSPDKKQELMFDVDGGNEQVHIFDRVAATILSSFGRHGHMAGDFTFVHTVAVDKAGSLYLGETVGGRRFQKFVKDGGDNNDNNDNNGGNHDN
jgi:DNA-binding beta-propeller fold protein YncE